MYPSATAASMHAPDSLALDLSLARNKLRETLHENEDQLSAREDRVS